MRRKKALVVFLLVVTLSVLLCMPFPSLAQEYSFSLDQEVVDVWVNRDGSVTLEYWFTFTSDRGNTHIAAVDVGLPNGDYRISDVRGDVDGRPIDYVDSDYEGKGDHGVAVWLGDATIGSGETATVHVVVERVGSMVYEDSDDPEYASTEFSPTWFGSEYVHGTTDLTVRFHLPPGVQPEEPRWHRSPSGWPYDQPETGLDQDGRVVYTWRYAEAQPDRQYVFGASYPRRTVDESAIQKAPSFLDKIFGVITAVLCNPGSCFIVAIGAFFALSAWTQRRRKMQYLPPSMKVEGVGVKRGLTAVEAAILLETPLDKVLTMILFGLLKKGAVTVLDDKPLKIERKEPWPENLHGYEKGFLRAVKKDGTLSESKLRSTITGLIKTVNSKMKAFSRDESVAYYRDIVRRAWKQVEGAETPEVRSQRFDEGLEWTMLDDDFDDRTERVFRTGPVYVPMWWGYHRPLARATASAGSRPARSAGAPSTGSRPSAPSLPTLPGAAFAATVVRGVEGTASNMVRNVTDFTAGVTEVTNPPPKPSSGGRGGGGGGGCACACACAGCACACAGGGR
jgi:hypothetical protein